MRAFLNSSSLNYIQSIIEKNKPALRIVGYIFSLGFIALILFSLYQDREELSNISLDKSFFLTCILSVLIVLVGNIINSFANWLLLSGSFHNVKFYHLLAINGFSQLAKYLPGNVFHLVGRFFLLKKYTGGKVSLYFSFYETALQIVVAATIGIFYLKFIDLLPSFSLISYIFIYGVITLSSIYFLYRLKLISIHISNLISAYGINLLSFGLYGVALFAILAVVLEQSGLNFVLLSIVFAISFLAGYVMPGASGGLGVREYMFMLLAQPFMDNSVALSAVVIFRLCSVSGDLLFSLFAMVIKNIYKVEFLEK